MNATTNNFESAPGQAAVAQSFADPSLASAPLALRLGIHTPSFVSNGIAFSRRQPGTPRENLGQQVRPPALSPTGADEQGSNADEGSLWNASPSAARQQSNAAAGTNQRSSNDDNGSRNPNGANNTFSYFHLGVDHYKGEEGTVDDDDDDEEEEEEEGEGEGEEVEVVVGQQQQQEEEESVDGQDVVGGEGDVLPEGLTGDCE